MAVQQYIYEGPWFSILLAFLAINIFCAASIRFPWKRRQTGFVVTHVGLLTLIFGSWWGFQYSDEGQAGGPEGGVIDRLVRTKYPVVRVKELAGTTSSSSCRSTAARSTGPRGSTRSSASRRTRSARPSGAIYPRPGRRTSSTSPPRAARRCSGSDPGPSRPGPRSSWTPSPTPDQQWFSFAQSTQGYRITRKAGGAMFAFLYVDRPELVDDFLNPPKDYGTLGVARLHYADKSGKPRRYDLRIDDARPGVPFDLPDSDLKVAFLDEETLGEGLDLLRFTVRRGDGREVVHLGVAGRPMAPATMPMRGGPAETPLLRVDYDKPPLLGGGMVEDARPRRGPRRPAGQTLLPRLRPRRGARPARRGPEAPPRRAPQGPRAAEAGRDDRRLRRQPEPADDARLHRRGVPALGRGEDDLRAAADGEGKQSDGVAAALVELTVDGQTKDVWVQRPAGLETPPYTRVNFRGKAYDVAFDSEREPLGFSMLLEGFRGRPTTPARQPPRATPARSSSPTRRRGSRTSR